MTKGARSAKLLKTSPTISDELSNKLSEIGEQADKQSSHGNYKGALSSYGAILEELKKSGQIDSYLLAKLTLGSLRAHIKLGNLQEALEIWNAELDQSLYGVGVYALENAQSEIDDLISYDMICAYLHTVIDENKMNAAHAVNLYLSRVCDHAKEQGSRALMIQALSNWKAHLKQIYGASLPLSAAESLIQYERDFGETVKPRAIDFPLASRWKKPLSFRETSTIVAKKALGIKTKKRA